MASALQLRDQHSERIVFLREFLKHPQQVASIVPSSRFLERRVVEVAGVGAAHTIVELGAGTGGITRAILRALRADGTLLAVEVNPSFCALLRRVPVDRLIVHRGDAQELRDAIALHALPAPDVIISGIPFSTMSRSAGVRILETISSVLRPGGYFAAYQIGGHVNELASPLLGSARVEIELLNIPPMRIYRWKKHAAKTLSPMRSGIVGELSLERPDFATSNKSFLAPSANAFAIVATGMG
jgi:phospholipid N-methyltransferase